VKGRCAGQLTGTDNERCIRSGSTSFSMSLGKVVSTVCTYWSYASRKASKALMTFVMAAVFSFHVLFLRSLMTR